MSRISQRRDALEQSRVLERLIADAERELRRAFRDEIDRLQHRVTLAALERAIAARRKHVVDPELLALTARVLARVSNAQSVKASDALARRYVRGLDFDAENAQAVRAAERRASYYERRFVKEQTQNYRRIIADGLRRGENPRVIAKDLRSSIGLSPYESRIVINYRRALEEGRGTTQYKLRDRSLDKGSPPREPLTQTQIDARVQRYRERRVDHRAEMFARREAHTAVHEGAQDMWDQAVDKGDVDKGEMVREWIATSDERTREHHIEMDGQHRKLDEPFVSGLGNRLMFPGDPSAPSEEVEGCRCTVAVVFK